MATLSEEADDDEGEPVEDEPVEGAAWRDIVSILSPYILNTTYRKKGGI